MFVATFLLAAPAVFGQDTNTEPKPEPTFLDRAVQVKERALEKKDALLERQQEARKTAAELAAERDLRKEQLTPEARQEERAAAIEEKKEIQAERKEAVRVHVEERKQLMRVNLEERKEQVMEKRAAFASSTAERKELFKERVTEAVSKRFDHAMQVLSAMSLRLTGLADRIEARISELSEGGADTSAAESALGTARTKIAAAEDAITAVADATASALASENPRELLGSIQPSITRAKEALRSAHEALRATVSALPKREDTPAQ